MAHPRPICAFWYAEQSQTPQHETLIAWMPPAYQSQPSHSLGQTSYNSWKWFHPLTRGLCSYCVFYPECPALPTWQDHLFHGLHLPECVFKTACWVNGDHYFGLRKTRKYHTGRSCLPIKQGWAGSLNKCSFYGRITAPTSHTATYASVVKVMHFSYQNYLLLYSKEKSNFLYLPEENNDHELWMIGHLQWILT